VSYVGLFFSAGVPDDAEENDYRNSDQNQNRYYYSYFHYAELEHGFCPRI
jgi:hypothetical protein